LVLLSRWPLEAGPRKSIWPRAVYSSNKITLLVSKIEFVVEITPIYTKLLLQTPKTLFLVYLDNYSVHVFLNMTKKSKYDKRSISK
jgi:hypothetical protein